MVASSPFAMAGVMSTVMGVNPRNVAPGANDDYEDFVMNGGWDDAPENLLGAHYSTAHFDARNSDVGFRCARDH